MLLELLQLPLETPAYEKRRVSDVDDVIHGRLEILRHPTCTHSA
jgi:hypothetical protein